MALNKWASQYEQNPEEQGIWPARLAVDGKKECTRVNNTTVTVSGYSKYPWWLVDLGAIYDISRIVVYGRADGVGFGTCG